MPAPDPTIATLGDTLRAVAARFRAAGLDTPDLDARILLEAATGVPREALVATPERAIGTAQLERLASYADRRLAHEPVSRILGVRRFWGREFEITPDTLDPRPDSETLIAAALELCAENVSTDGRAGRPLRILDIGSSYPGWLRFVTVDERGWTQIFATSIDESRVRRDGPNPRPYLRSSASICG